MPKGAEGFNQHGGGVSTIAQKGSTKKFQNPISIKEKKNYIFITA